MYTEYTHIYKYICIFIIYMCIYSIYTYMYPVDIITQ